MAKITKVHAREILDSRGNPTVECEMTTTKGIVRASVPSGASTGVHEALELRDHGEKFFGKGVGNAVENVKKIGKKLIGKDPRKQKEIDELLIKLDGTQNKTKLGANSILAVSMAVCKAGALAKKEPVYKHIATLASTKKLTVPVPHFNIINGGKHAGTRLAIQEYMIAPVGAKNFSEALRIGSETYHKLKQLLEHKYGRQAINVGDEGGFAPQITDIEEPLNMIRDTLISLGYQNKVTLAIDAAATSFWHNGTYYFDGKEHSVRELTQKYREMTQKYRLTSIEDPFHEEAFEDFAMLTKSLPKTEIIGDDLTVTNPKRIQQAIEMKSCNGLLLKINQIGTITEAIDAAKIVRNTGWKIMVSHRSGETTDNFIADLAVGLGVGHIKSGAPCRGERLAKYNQLLRISEKVKRYGI